MAQSELLELAKQVGSLFEASRSGDADAKNQLKEVGQHVMTFKKNNSTIDPEFKALFEGENIIFGKCIAGLKEAGLLVKAKRKKLVKKKKTQAKKKEKTKQLELKKESFHALSKEWMEHQPTINLMTIGHVANGKSTSMRALSGVVTMRHTTELKNNMTIKLGYTSFKIFRVPGVHSPECFVPRPSSDKEYICPNTGKKGELIRHFSFLDNPGHQIYMRNMLVGASVADGALLIIAANAPKCPEKQTEEHLIATRMLGLTNIVVAQNKIDLVTEEKAARQYEQIVNFLRRNHVGNVPVVPICAETKINIDALCAHLVKRIQVVPKELNVPTRLHVIRSFDVNKPQQIKNAKDFKGGVAGCVLMQGFLKVGDELEIRPGYVTTNDMGELEFQSISVRVESLLIGKSHVQYCAPGCNVGVGLNVDPIITRSDYLVGQVLGTPGTLPPVFTECVIEYRLLKTVVGAEKMEKVSKKLKPKDKLNIAIGSRTVGAEVVKCNMTIQMQDGSLDTLYSNVDSKKRMGTALLKLDHPVCYDLWTKLLITKDIGQSWRLIGCGKIRMINPEVSKMIDEN